MINPITALMYLFSKRLLKENPKEKQLLIEIENELDKADSINFEKAKEQARKIYPVDVIEKNEDLFMKSIDKICEYQELFNVESEKEILSKYRITPEQMKVIKEKRFIKKAKKITQPN